MDIFCAAIELPQNAEQELEVKDGRVRKQAFGRKRLLHNIIICKPIIKPRK